MRPRCRRSRDPARQAWRGWNPDQTRRRTEIPSVGTVESWCEVTRIQQPLVSFRWSYRFEASGAVLTSDSTLRFRDSAEMEHALEQGGFAVEEIRDAPDRPGLEFVFVAVRSD